MKITVRDIPPRAVWALEQGGVHPLLARLYGARGVSAMDELDEGDEPPPAICVFDPDFDEGGSASWHEVNWMRMTPKTWPLMPTMAFRSMPGRASKPPTALGRSDCCAIAPVPHSPWIGSRSAALAPCASSPQKTVNAGYYYT